MAGRPGRARRGPDVARRRGEWRGRRPGEDLPREGRRHAARRPRARGQRRDPRGVLRRRRAREGGRRAVPPQPDQVQVQPQERPGQGGRVQVEEALRRLDLRPAREDEGRVAGRRGQGAFRPRRGRKRLRGRRGRAGRGRVQPLALRGEGADQRQGGHGAPHEGQLRLAREGRARDHHPDHADPRALLDLKRRFPDDVPGTLREHQGEGRG